MQVIYAAPFIFLALIGFLVSAIVPRFRSRALAVLVAPVAFSVCSIIGYAAWVLVCGYILRIQLRPVTGIHGFFEVVFFYLAPGLAGSWIAVRVTHSLQRRLLRQTR
jgi:hypothetical protein